MAFALVIDTYAWNVICRCLRDEKFVLQQPRTPCHSAAFPIQAQLVHGIFWMGTGMMALMYPYTNRVAQ